MASRTLPKRERLCSRYLIDRLFEPGNSRSFTAYPLRAVFRCGDDTATEVTQILISVPKRQFKHAIDRNRVKRQVREAYRNNKTLLPPDSACSIAFIWLDSKHYPSSVVTAKVRNLLHRINESCAQF